jgi:pimeloyl-ACP methyl ester carboxylesterase
MDEYDRPHVTIGHVGRSKPLGARWCGTGRTDKPLLVFLHGGGYDDRYFDIPGQSVIEQAAAAGYGAVSITRPGYPTDTASAADHPTFAQAAEILDDAISDAWNEFGGGPGVVLVTHSIGSAVGLHLAARDLGFPLLGVATSAISDTLAPAAAGVIASMPPHHPVELPFPPMRNLLYGPDWTVSASMLEMAPRYLVDLPSDEVAELATSWATELKEISPQVQVPVLHVLAEFDGMWDVSPESVARMAGYFTNAPFVDATLWRGAGHNIEHHIMGPAFVNVVMSFADRCAMETRRLAV